MKSTFLCLLLCVGVNATAEEEPAAEKPTFTPAGHTTDTLDTVKARLKSKSAVLLDVREEQEWDEGHLQVAKLVPLSAIRAGNLTAEMKKNMPKDKPIYCHCRSGRRVLAASKILRAQGYDVRPLTAGYEPLLKAGFEKAKDKKD